MGWEGRLPRAGEEPGIGGFTFSLENVPATNGKQCQRAAQETRPCLCRESVPDDGALLLVEWDVLGANEPSMGKFIDVVMLVLMGGRERSLEEYGKLLASAGFRLNRTFPTSAHFVVMEALPV